jgi:hypothetical protein
MRKGKDMLAFIHARKSRARLVFLLAFLVCMAYYGTWQLWRWSNLPGIAIILGSLPWSWPWLEDKHLLAHSIPWPLRNAVTAFVLSLGFSINSALVYLASAAAHNKWFKPKSTPTLRSGVASA